jgi:hypothetical protein
MDAGNEVVEDDNDDALSLTARERINTAAVKEQHPFATSQDDQQPLSSIRHRHTDPNSMNGDEGRKSSKMQQPRDAQGLLMGGEADFGEESGNDNEYASSD